MPQLGQLGGYCGSHLFSFVKRKAWKRFAASVESVTKSLKQKDAKGALAAYGEALVLLDEYLKLVELPEAKEIAVA
jgi:hypothetical protein